MYQALKILHILAAMIFGGGVFLVAALQLGTARLPEFAEQVRRYRMLARDAAPLITAAGLIAVGSGVTLAIRGSWPLFRGWILLSMIWMVLEGTAALLLDRRKRAVLRRAESALAEGTATAIEEAQRSFTGPVILWTALLNTLLILGYVFLMVMKPAWP